MPQPLHDRRTTARRIRDQELIRREQELCAAVDICEELFHHIKVDDLIQHTLTTACDIVQAEAGSILLADAARQQLIFRCSVGEKPVVPGTAIAWNQGIAGAVFQSGQPLVVHDVKNDARHLPDIDVVTGYCTRDMISIPLKRWRGGPIGVLNVLNKRVGILTENDLQILTLVSGFSAIAIEQARLYEDAKLAAVMRLLGDLGHDVKNFLTPIVQSSDLLHEEVGSIFKELPRELVHRLDEREQRCRRLIELLKRGSVRLRRHMQEIADCVKGMSTPPQFHPSHLDDIVDAVLRTLKPTADEKGVHVVARGADSLPNIDADEHRLFNALYNLLNNAIMDTDSGGTVTIQVQLAGDNHVVISIRDTGHGMPPEVLKSLFSDKAISRKAGGTGLGTKIVKDIVNAHCGSVWAESELGKGTSVYVMLPLLQGGI